MDKMAKQRKYLPGQIWECEKFKRKILIRDKWDITFHDMRTNEVIKMDTAYFSSRVIVFGAKLVMF